jgi:hypothetical protein
VSGVTSNRCHLCGVDAHIADKLGGWCVQHWAEANAARKAEEQRLTAEAGGPWPQTCPSRMQELGPWSREENLDTWDVREQMHGGLVARHCSFCGSLHPDDLIRLVKDEGYRIAGTDKGYKAYVDAPGERQVSKFYFWHLSDEQRAELRLALVPA